jgi:hypothetical protein
MPRLAVPADRRNRPHPLNRTTLPCAAPMTPPEPSPTSRARVRCRAPGRAQFRVRLVSTSPADQAWPVQPQCNGSATHPEARGDRPRRDVDRMHADALRQALRMTNEEFAEHLSVSARAVACWRARPGSVRTSARLCVMKIIARWRSRCSPRARSSLGSSALRAPSSRPHRPSPSAALAGQSTTRLMPFCERNDPVVAMPSARWIC